mgnify:CR=1 FL=1
MKKPKQNPLWLKPYEERLRGYHADKEKFLRENAHKSASFFVDGLKALADKWNI